MTSKAQHTTKEGRTPPGAEALSRRHLRWGWWSLLVFLTMGLVLESMHGFKVAWYMELANTTRRFTWTLAHAHGTLLAVVNLALGATMTRMTSWSPRLRRLASDGLLAATVLLPAGFFLGGLFPFDGDPGPGILLVPVGGGLLALSVLAIAIASTRARAD